MIKLNSYPLLVKTDITGRTYGNLKVIKPAPSQRWRGCWLCECKCGKRSVKTRSDLCRKGRNVSGCSIRCPFVIQAVVQAHKTHGMSHHRAFYVYNNMLARCYRPTAFKWPSYGGRGITVCKRWRESFENFWEDMGPGYIYGLTLHRIDNNGNYTLKNCCWVTWKVQARNRRDTVAPHGAPENFREIALSKGIKTPTLYNRIARGMSWARILDTPRYSRSW